MPTARGRVRSSSHCEREGKLQNLFLGDGVGVTFSRFSKRLRGARLERLGPCIPCAGIELAAQDGVEGVIGEPC